MVNREWLVNGDWRLKIWNFRMKWVYTIMIILAAFIILWLLLWIFWDDILYSLYS